MANDSSWAVVVPASSCPAVVEIGGVVEIVESVAASFSCPVAALVGGGVAGHSSSCHRSFDLLRSSCHRSFGLHRSSCHRSFGLLRSSHHSFGHYSSHHYSSHHSSSCHSCRVDRVDHDRSCRSCRSCLDHECGPPRWAWRWARSKSECGVERPVSDPLIEYRWRPAAVPPPNRAFLALPFSRRPF